MAAQVISEGLEVVIGGSFGLAEFREAYAQTLARKLPGKTVITIDPR